MNADSILEVSNLSYTYRGHWFTQRIAALKDIDFSVSQGESFGFLGHNGAGKTTAIKCLLGLIRPRTGSIRIFGKQHSNLNQKRLIGYLPERPYFYDHLNVLEIMQFYASLYGLHGTQADERIEQALSLLQLTDRCKAPMRSLSKGLIQRVGMAQAIVARPQLLVLDEPFSGLDPIGRVEFRDLIQQLKDEGTTIFISSHILSDVEFLCDRVLILARGESRGTYKISSLADYIPCTYELVLAEYGDQQERFTNCADSHCVEKDTLKLSYSAHEPAYKALQEAIQSSITVQSFNPRHGSLEDLFVQLVTKAQNE